MSTECTPEQLDFHALGRREVVGRFDGGRLTSDGGGLLLREGDRRLGR
ncbi:MAG: transposase, partial [Proteobacteria bacterium]|nr:transposase [Pseudomonadota bacterium]